MSEGTAIIISAIITVGGMVVIQVLNYFQRKKDFEDQLFHEAYQKRRMVYEDVIKELQNTAMQDVEKIPDIKGLEMSELILEKAHLLDTLMSRLTLFGSTNSLAPLFFLRYAILQLHAKCLDIPVDEAGSIAVEVVKLFKAANQQFITIVSKETGSNLVDKRIKIPGIKKNKKKTHQNNNPPINKQRGD